MPDVAERERAEDRVAERVNHDVAVGMRDDAAIVQAARVSYGRGTKKVREDAGLIRYLMRHRHTTPFEMCEIKYHVKLPVFVARQWIRHRTANVNEYSARYSILDREFYIPAPAQLAAQSTANRQGRGDVLDGPEAVRVLDLLKHDAERNYDHYTEMLNEREDREISTQEIGAFIMERLREIDQVAYVRFASVYRRFEDIDAFMDVVKSLLKPSKEG